MTGHKTPIKGFRLKDGKLIKTKHHLDASKRIASQKTKRIVTRAQAIGIRPKGK